MRFLYCTDLHGDVQKYEAVIKYAIENDIKLIHLGADILPKGPNIQERQKKFIKVFLKVFYNECKKIGIDVLAFFGNDDLYSRKKYFKEYAQLLDEVPFEKEGYTFKAYGYVPDYPFGYKFWCRAEHENNLRIDPVQFCEPLILNKSNEFEVIEDYPKYLRNQNSICKSLFTRTINIKNIQKSIWLIHAPPANLLLDVCADGRKVGSNTIYEFITNYQPLITIHGHIHESPEYNGNNWYHQENKTLCIQGGQIGFKLHYSIIDIENEEIKNVWHSTYGNKT